MGSNQIDSHGYHMHTPVKSQNAFKRFFSFLFHSNKIFSTYDHTGTCAFCGVPIRSPSTLNTRTFEYICRIAALFLTIPWMLFSLFNRFPAFLIVLGGFLIVFFVEWIAVSVVLAVYPWREYDTSTFDVYREHNSIKKTRENRLWQIASNAILATVISHGIFKLLR